MSNLEIVRAWKDPEFRATLGGIVPEHPAGEIKLADPGLDSSAVGRKDPFAMSHDDHSCQTIAFSKSDPKCGCP